MSGSFAYGQSKGSSQQSSAQNVWGPMQGPLQQLFGGAQQAASGIPQWMQGIQSPALDAFKSALAPQGNPYLSQMVGAAQRRLGESFSEYINPALRSEAIHAGAYGSPEAANAQALAAKNVTQQMGDISTGMYGAAYDQDRARMMQGLMLAPQMSNLPMAPWQGFQQAMGPPIVLGTSQGSSMARSWQTQMSGGIW
jgi:hypothetical protein